jgi:hypothetical protein
VTLEIVESLDDAVDSRVIVVGPTIDCPEIGIVIETSGGWFAARAAAPKAKKPIIRPAGRGTHPKSYNVH